VGKWWGGGKVVGVKAGGKFLVRKILIIFNFIEFLYEKNPITKLSVMGFFSP
jgi:hypothetical protein